MNECQVWWTLTGNFGNIMPIDWTKTYTRHFRIFTNCPLQKHTQGTFESLQIILYKNKPTQGTFESLQIILFINLHFQIFTNYTL